MSLIDQIYQSFWFQVFWLLAAILVGAILTNFRRQLLRRYRHIRARMLNTPARVTAIYVSKYRDPPKSWLSKDVFDTLSNRLRTDKLRKLSSSEKSIEMFSEKLGMPLSISLEEEPEVATVSDRKIIGYKVAIELEAELRIGLRSLSEFQYFVALVTVSEQTIREKCFPGDGPYQQFILCDIRRDGPITFPTPGDRTDPDLAVKVAVHDSQVNLVFDEPMQSLEALKKYFPW